jgi:hypothetical protein
VVGTYNLTLDDLSVEFNPVIPIATATRLSVRGGSSVAAANFNVKLHVIDQANTT